MFTGIVEEIGLIKSFDGRTLVIECSKVLENTVIGVSISVDGCCQTVVSFCNNSFSTNLSDETLNITKGFKIGSYVNLERALSVNSRLGGHIVQGHVDSTAEYIGNSTFKINKDLSKYIVYKGAITINGISLTVSNVENEIFKVAIIPHTLENTTLKFLKLGDLVNIETDILGRYVEKFLSLQNNKSNVSEKFLIENGFM